MFEKFKQLAKLKQMQSSLSKEKVEVEKEGVRVALNGKMEVERIELNPEMSKERQEMILKECLNDASRKLRTSLAQKFSQGI